ncbi:unnamed protein product [Cuscuta campestris]|uniref:NAC domain-containing protein n=1 Tax=Cuscuta campestris TaxID=132261 RepID=A0A484MVZ3_9ASTE|nr:unnamed protein product [Cuscuta campestris]
MENDVVLPAVILRRPGGEIDLPPGFRFHPTDEELITHYLGPKARDAAFSPRAIAEVDFNSVEPWDLPWRAKMGEREWYFFCVRDRKYPTGERTNRATRAGYWKATGKDKGIFKGQTVVGVKKTLVFYKGRAPRGEKTNWVMHEYRLHAKSSISNTKNEWVLCRIFKKMSGGHKIHISSLIKGDSSTGEIQEPPSALPPLVDVSHPRPTTAHVTCFSDEKSQPDPTRLAGNLLLPCQVMPCLDHSVLRLWFENNGLPTKEEDDEKWVMSSTGGPVDLECLWNY